MGCGHHTHLAAMPWFSQDITFKAASACAVPMQNHAASSVPHRDTLLSSTAALLALAESQWRQGALGPKLLAAVGCWSSLVQLVAQRLVRMMERVMEERICRNGQLFCCRWMGRGAWTRCSQR